VFIRIFCIYVLSVSVYIYPILSLDKVFVKHYIVLGLVNSPFRFKGAWSEEFKLYSIGRDPDGMGLYSGMDARKILAYAHLLP
jgi:hypothetical protein